MRKGTIKGSFLVAALLMGLTGCGKNEIPQLTEEELWKISEFTAFTLMKYEAGHKSRLVDLEELGLEVPGGAVTDPGSDTPAVPELDEEDKGDSEGEEDSQPAGMDPVDDTPVVNEPGGTTPDAYTAEEVLGLPGGVMLVYAGEEVCESYPKDGNDYFSLDATEGKQLLVLHFQITNTGEEEQHVDILSLQPQIRITVNESLSRQALPTMLEDDLVFLEGDIPAGDSREVILVVEVDQELAEDITAISLNVGHDGKNCYMKIL